MNVKSKKIFVTGADGFIGSHLTEELDVVPPDFLVLIGFI